MENFDAMIESTTPSRPSKEEWAELKRQERDELYACVDKTAAEVFSDPAKLAQYLNMQARLGRASANNALLAVAQRPDAKHLFTYDEWQERGRSLKRGEFRNAVKQFRQDKEYVRDDGTIAMGYNVERCYDLNQTFGKEYSGRSNLTMPMKSKIRGLLTNTSVPVKLSDEVQRNVGALYSEQDQMIYVARELEGNALFFSIAREMARADGCESTFLCSCAASIACLRFGIQPKYPDHIPEDMTFLSAKDKRTLLGNVREAAYKISGRIDQNLYTERQQKKNEQQR